MADDHSLNDLYTDDPPYDRDQVLETLLDYVQIDKETGEPVPQSEFHEAAPDIRVISLLLYREIAAELGELSDEDIPADEAWLKSHANAENADIGKWDMDFISQTNGQFVIPPHSVEAALDFIESMR